jgi:RNA polymerase sigma-70 factor, ECF subfamily
MPLYMWIGPENVVGPARAVTHRDIDDARLSDLARRAAGGHSPSTQQLLIDLLPRVRNLVRYLVRGDNEVDDLSQEALLLILQGIGSYRGEGAFRSWADRVVVRSVLAARKASKRWEYADVSELAAEGATSADRYCLRRRLVQELDALPLPQRHALVLHYVLGLTIPQISEELSVSDETVRSRIRLGKDRLRQQLAEEPNHLNAGMRR